MRESTLASYFSGEIDIFVFRHELADVVGANTLLANENYVADLSYDYEIKKEHLIRLCCAFLGNEINSEELKATAFFLLGSDHFIWDADFKEGELIAEVIHDWAAPEINYILSHKNISLYRTGLEEGRYPFKPVGDKPR